MPIDEIVELSAINVEDVLRKISKKIVKITREKNVTQPAKLLVKIHVRK